MASVMKKRGVVGCVVAGRVRDLVELKKSNLPVCVIPGFVCACTPSAFIPKPRHTVSRSSQYQGFLIMNSVYLVRTRPYSGSVVVFHQRFPLTAVCHL